MLTIKRNKLFSKIEKERQDEIKRNVENKVKLIHKRRTTTMVRICNEDVRYKNKKYKYLNNELSVSLLCGMLSKLSNE